MKYSEVKKCLKKDDTTIGVKVYRKAGIILTWIVINCLPFLSANMITASMLIFNAISGAFLYNAIITESISKLVISILIFNFSITLDCVDGNIARIKNQSSFYGIFLDRLVHNITYPGLFWVIGFGIFNKTDSIIVLILFLIMGVLEEVSPIEVAIKDVKDQFLDQTLYRKTLVFNIENYKNEKVKNIEYTKEVVKEKKMNKISPKIILDIIPLWNRLFLLVIIDIYFFYNKFYLIIGYTILFMIYKILKQIKSIRRELEKAYEKLSKL